MFTFVPHHQNLLLEKPPFVTIPKKVFPILGESHFDDATLGQERKKGWKRKASGLVLNLVAKTAGTTPSNFKKILKKEKKYSSSVRKQVKAIPNIEEHVLEDIPILGQNHRVLEMEKVSEKKYIAGIRSLLALSAPSIEEPA